MTSTTKPSFTVAAWASVLVPLLGVADRPPPAKGIPTPVFAGVALPAAPAWWPAW